MNQKCWNPLGCRPFANSTDFKAPARNKGEKKETGRQRQRKHLHLSLSGCADMGIKTKHMMHKSRKAADCSDSATRRVFLWPTRRIISTWPSCRAITVFIAHLGQRNALIESLFSIIYTSLGRSWLTDWDYLLVFLCCWIEFSGERRVINQVRPRTLTPFAYGWFMGSMRDLNFARRAAVNEMEKSFWISNERGSDEFLSNMSFIIFTTMLVGHGSNARGRGGDLFAWFPYGL